MMRVLLKSNSVSYYKYNHNEEEINLISGSHELLQE